MCIDVVWENDVEVMCVCVVECFGCFDIVFNNVGVGGVIGLLIEMMVEDWDYIFDVFVKGVFFGIKYGV